MVHEQTLNVLLIERGIVPFKGLYALPGGFVLAEETLEQAAFRELFEETGTKDVYLEHLYTFGDPHRDPRDRVVTVAYYALVPTDKSPLLAGTDAATAGLTRFLDYPELELSNNLAENSMRPVAIGRRNWTHIGHEKAGPRVAAILSIVETCRRLKIPVREYLAAVLPGLANLSIQRLPELTPTAWAVSNL
jgi:8-oxo-dGTP diphosphatase